MMEKLSYKCLDTQVHIVPLQVMIGQLMRSSGTCERCGQVFTASTGDSREGGYP